MAESGDGDSLLDCMDDSVMECDQNNVLAKINDAVGLTRVEFVSERHQKRMICCHTGDPLGNGGGFPP